MIRTHFRLHLIAAGRAAGTVKLRMLHLEHLERRVRLLDATEYDLEEHLARLRDSHGPEARRSIRATLVIFYSWAHSRGAIATNPAARLETIRVPRILPRVAPDAAILDALPRLPLEEQAMVLLGRLAGLRLSEITSAHSDNREGDMLRVVGKGEKERAVPLVTDLRIILETLERINGQGFYIRGRFGGHMHPTSVSKIITRATGWNPHSLRHAFATAAYRSTRDLRAVQALLGHSSLATTERYLHNDQDALRAAAAGSALIAA